MKREVHTRGVVVARAASGEGSLRVSILTEDLGLVRALGTSARLERSKLRGHLVAGSYGTYSFVRGARDWRIIGAVGTQNIFYQNAHDQHRQNEVARIIALVRQFVHGEEANAGLFRALWGSADELPFAQAESVVTIRVLSALGYVADLPESLDEMTELDRAKIITTALSASGL